MSWRVCLVTGEPIPIVLIPAPLVRVFVYPLAEIIPVTVVLLKSQQVSQIVGLESSIQSHVRPLHGIDGYRLVRTQRPSIR